MSMLKRAGIVKRTGMVAIAAALLFAAVELGEKLSVPGASSVSTVISSAIKSADAVVGRPLTPVSVAGVARRTCRRN